MFTTLLLLAAVAPPPAAPPPTVIARWIEELGDDEFTVREAASRKLQNAGQLAEPALQKALNHTDAEIRLRAKTILAELKWGILPNTPEPIAELIRSYRAAARSERGEVLRKLLAAGEPGCRAVVRIAYAEDDALVRSEVFRGLTDSVFRQAPLLIDQGELSRLEALLELRLAADPRATATHYAAFHALTGQLPRTIALWEARSRSVVVPKWESEILAYLYRANGELDRAAKAAARAELMPLLEALLYESADWKTLAASPNEFPVPNETRSTRGQAVTAGYRLAYLRLAGKQENLQAQLDLLQNPKGSRADALPYAKALFLNGYADLGLEVLSKSEYSPRMVFEIYYAQNRVKQALAVVEAARKSGSSELASLEILEAKILAHLGEKERAFAQLKQYTDAIQPGADEPWHQDLVETELFLDRRQQALAATAKILTATGDNVRASRLLDKLFDPKGDEAYALYKVLRRLEPRQPFDQTLARLEKLLDGKEDVKDLVNRLKLDDAETPPDDWRIVGEVCRWAKQDKLAIDCFRQANTPLAWIRLADLHAANKDWDKAAMHYHAAYQLGLKQEIAPTGEATPCLALWLSGHALVQAGRQAEGKARMERAHLLPLADGQVRFDFLRALRKRKHQEAVRREEQSLRRFGEPILSEPDSYFTGEGLRAAAIDLATRKEWLRAADGYEQTFLRCLQPMMNFTRGSAYVTVPGHIFALRVKGLLTADRLDEALVEAARARRSLPGNIELATYLIPELEERGRSKEADDWYRQIREPFAEVLAAYPKCAWARNQIAWLAVSCRRDLDEALKHAQQAVALAPESASYHDTLAEVLFQLGKQDEAIAAQKKAIALQPDRAIYKKQLERFQSGDRSRPRIEEED